MLRVVRSLCKTIHLLKILWGAAILVIYGRAAFKGRHLVDGCLDTTAPWFSSKYPCSVLNFNCFRNDVTSPMGIELDNLDPQTLSFLSYLHCPAIHVPATIQRFPRLLGFQLYNCSIQSWSIESAISASKHPHLIVVVLVRVNMTELPAGFMQPLPESVSDIDISKTNLTKLPDNLHERWHQLSVLFIEYSELTELPKTIFQIPSILVSFVGNKFRSLPSLDAAHSLYYILDLGGNPLQELPAAIGARTYIVYLNVERCELTSLPPWVSTNVSLPFGFGNPYCQYLNHDAPSAETAGCLVQDPRGGGRIPIDIIDSKLGL